MAMPLRTKLLHNTQLSGKRLISGPDLLLMSHHPMVKLIISVAV